jgi:hypothetical protein
MTIHDLALLAWVPAVLALTWHLRKLNQAHDKLNEKARLDNNWLMSGHQIHKDKIAALQTGIKAIEVRTRGFDPTQTARELRHIREQLNAITEHLRPQTDDCRHEYRFFDHQHHITRFKCDWCLKTVDIDPTEQLRQQQTNN